MYFKPKTVLCAHFIKIDDPCEHIIQFSSSRGVLQFKMHYFYLKSINNINTTTNKCFMLFCIAIFL